MIALELREETAMELYMVLAKADVLMRWFLGDQYHFFAPTMDLVSEQIERKLEFYDP
nr:hypothetical protein [uncultured Methanolobus sp.]